MLFGRCPNKGPKWGKLSMETPNQAQQFVFRSTMGCPPMDYAMGARGYGGHRPHGYVDISYMGIGNWQLIGY